MEFVASLLVIAFVGALVLLLNYYRRLLNDGRREYPRDELIYAHNFIVNEWQRIVSVDPATSYAGVAAGILLGYMLSYSGAVFGEHYDSNFFHSAVLPGLWFIGQPYLKDKADEMQWPTFVRKFIENDTTFFFGLSVTFAAQSLISYGFYHAPNFLWVFFNTLALMGLVLYYFYKRDNQEKGGLPDAPRRENRI